MRYVCSGCDIRASHFHLTLFLGKQHKINSHPLDKNYKSGSRRVLRMLGVLIPSLRIIDSRTQDLVARPRLVLSFFRFTSSVSFPSFGMNNARWRLFCHFLSPVVFSRTVFFRLRQLATLLGTLRSWPLAGPSSLSESLLAFVVCLFIGCSCFCTVIYLPALPYCIVYISLLFLLAGCLVIFVRWVLYPNSSALRIREWHSLVDLCGVIP